MQRIINFRPFLLTAIFAISAVVSGVLYVAVNNIFGVVLISILLASAVVFCVIFGKNAVRLTTFILCFVIALGCFIYSGLYTKDRNIVVEYGENVPITGRVCEVVSHDTSHSLVLEGISIDGENVSGKLSVRLKEGDTFTDYVRVGDRVTLVSRPIINKINVSQFSFSDIKYYAYSSLDELKVLPGTLDLREQILGSLRATYNNWLGKYGDLAYGIITGNKNGLTNEYRSAYSLSGLSHILAVSGLHVGFLMSLISAILKLFKVNNKVQLWICIPILLAYNLLVGFSFSIIRASIMFIISFIARLSGKRSDQLNNLALSVTVILCIFPYALFDIGFIMSVGCVFAISMFAKPLTDLMLKLSKNRLKKFFSALAVSMCAQLGVFPATIMCFSSFSFYSVIANVIAMPFLNIIYIYVLIFGILATLMPFMGYVLFLAKFLFMAIDYLNLFISFLPLSEITMYGSVGTLILYLLYFVVGKYTMLKKKLIPIILCAVLAVGVVLADNLRFSGDTQIVYSNARYDVTTLLKTGDKYVIVGDLSKYCKIESCVKEARVHKVESLYVTNLTANNISTVIRLADKYDVSAVYIRSETDTALTHELIINNVNVQLVSAQNTLYEIKENGKFVGFKYKNVLLTSFKTDLDDISTQYLSLYKVVRAYSHREIEGVKLALNFEYTENKDKVGANADEVLLDCVSLEQKRF